ncbi:glycosyltransferase [Heterostelium album PN500]|uniref:Fucosyltransferase n=1 Tax=Heterostelium pallidum (strain ATCC 26659 / Pp 5 / PN500) TaxID=670386 RepID=D3BPK3_HETP5|nr:glycosyltransferase [Heterostelium album PN500]EFA76721.1 glycosyltransferase [Heterostelium album PN500]|eukprot:XP_020428853.1 glycosyltransferase [Heterostelium album PN500]
MCVYNSIVDAATGVPLRGVVLKKPEEMDYERDEVKVVMFTGNGWSSMGKDLETPNYNGETKVKDKCPVKCTFLDDKQSHTFVDVVIFEAQPLGSWGYDYLSKPPKFPMKEPGQAYAAFSFEHSIYFPIQTEPEYLKYIDMNMTLFEDANIPITSTCSWGVMTNGSIDNFRDAPVKPFKKKQKHCVFFASNCFGGGAIYRTEYIKDLQKYIPVDAYGSCLHNKDLEKEDKDGNIFDNLGKSMNIKSRITGGYLFGLAFENNNITNYVTEKVYTVMLSGAVPIYMGAPNIDSYVPRKSIIKTDDFESPEALANYLKYLAKNESAYNEYFEWKKEPYPQSVIDNYKNCVFYSADCRLCQTVHAFREMKKKQLGDGFRVNYGEPDNVKHEKRVVSFTEKSCVIAKPTPETESKFTNNIDGVSMGAWIFVTKKVDDMNHVGFTFGNNVLKLFVNGLLDVEMDLQHQLDIHHKLLMRIGCRGTFNGMMDDISIWARELTTSEISKTMFEKMSGNEEKLLMYFTFNSGEVQDYSENKVMIINTETTIVDHDYQELRLDCCSKKGR